MGEYKKTLIPVITVIIMLFLYGFAKRGIYVQYDIIPNYENAPATDRISALSETYRHVFSILSALLSPSPDLPPDTSPPPPDIITQPPETEPNTPPPPATFSADEAIDAEPPIIYIKTFTYGKSEMGRNLICHRCKGAAAPKPYKILLVFEIHGFEDAYEKDGQLLVDIAECIFDYYKDNNDALNGCELYIVPSANPDGLLDGYTNNGFGRCQSSGYDINREFDAGKWTRNYTPRNKTGPQPLTSPESKALAELVLSIKPDIVVDFHGWLGMCFGSKDLSDYFREFHDMTYAGAFGSTNGYFAAWAKRKCGRALLYEFPSPLAYPDKTRFITNNSEKVIQGLNKIFREIEEIIP